jgi:hypothetical protein
VIWRVGRHTAWLFKGRSILYSPAVTADALRASFAFRSDDNDWPKPLYASVGFRPVACAGTFHRSFKPSD